MLNDRRLAPPGPVIIENTSVGEGMTENPDRPAFSRQFLDRLFQAHLVSRARLPEPNFMPSPDDSPGRFVILKPKRP